MPTPHTVSATHFARLLAQVEQIVRESGDPELVPDFDADAWLTGWLEHPAAVLGGRSPAEVLEAPDGFELVSGLLGAQQSGAYW
jgi:uncharacterized protein (DUF2384 family)